MIGFLALLIIDAVLFVASSLLLPKPKLPDARPNVLDRPTSKEGDPLPVVWGTMPLSANATYFGEVMAQEETQKIQTGLFSSHRVTTGYNYSALMQCALCHGPVDELLDVVFSDSYGLNDSVLQVAYTVVNQDGKDIWAPVTTPTDLTNPPLPAGPDDGLALTDPRDGRRFIVSAKELFGGYQHGGGLNGHFIMYWGLPDQHADPALAASISAIVGQPIDMPAYEGVAHVVFGYKGIWTGERDGHTGRKIDGFGNSLTEDTEIAPFNFGEQGTIPGIVFVVRRCPNGLGLADNLVNLGGGANPACCIYEALTNVTWAAQVPPSEIDTASFVTAATTLAAENFGINLALNSAEKTDSVITELLRYIDGQLQQNPLTGLLELTLNRADYVVDELLWLDDDNSTAEVTRPHWSSLINEVKVSFSQQQGVKFKTVTTQPVDDIASQHDLDLTVATTVAFPGVRDPVLANKLAVRSLRMGATPLARAKITTTREAALLKVGQPFRLSNAIAGINGHVFRVAAINWGTRTEGVVTIDAIEDVFDLETPFYDVPVDPPAGWTGAGPTNALHVLPIATADDTYGYLELQLTGGSGNVTRVQFREKSGAADWTAWHDNDAPDRFFDKVALADTGASQIGWQVLGVLKSGTEGPLADGTVDYGITTGSSALRLNRFREILRTPTLVRYGWELPVPNQISEIDGWGKLSDEIGDPPPVGAEDRLWRDTVTEPPDLRLAGDTITFDVVVPPNGKVQTWELVPFTKDGLRGFAQQVKVLPTPDVPRFGRLLTTTDPVGLSVTVTALDIDDPQALGGRLFLYLNHDFAEDPDEADPADGWLDVAMTPYTATFADDFTLADGVHTSFLLQSIRIHPDRGKRIFVEFVNSSGVSSGKVPFVLLGSGGIIDQNGQLIDASINRAEAFAAGIKPYSVYDALPSVGKVNEVAFLTTEKKLYRWDGTRWTPEVPATDITGVLTGDQIAAAAIDNTKLASSITAVELFTTLPSAPGAGRVAMMGGVLYRSTADGSGWTTQVPAVDLTGTINSAQIADAAITAAKLGAAAVTTAAIALSAITSDLLAANAVTATKISDGAISTPKLVAGAVTTAILAAGAVVTASITAGAITTATIATSAVTADTIATGAIIAGKVSASAITATELAANSVIAGKIQAGAVTATELAANSVIAGKVQAGAISTTELAANAITSTKIAAGEIISTHMTAGTILGDRIAANTLNASKIVSNSITASQIGADSIYTGALQAGAVTATAIHSGAVDATKVTTTLLSGVGPAGGGTLSNLGIIVAGKLVSVSSPSTYLDLNATGANPFLRLLSTLILYADGTATFSGQLSGATGTFSGSLSAASGTFAGTVTGNSFTASSINISSTDAQLVFTSPASSGAGIIWQTGGKTASLTTTYLSLALILSVVADTVSVRGTSTVTIDGASFIQMKNNSLESARFDTPSSATGDMGMWLLHHTDAGTYVLKRVTCGGADSAGGGWRTLRVTN